MVSKTSILMLGTHITTMGGIASVVRNYFDYGMMDRLRICYMATHRDGSKIRKILFYLKQVPLIALKMPACRLVHIHTSQGWSFRRLLVLFLIAKLLRKATIWHVHGSSFDAYFDKASKMEKTLIRLALSRASRVIALSEHWRGKLSAMAPAARIVVIRNAVNVPRYRVLDRRRHEPVAVLFLGRLGQRKGIYDLLRAIDVVRERPIRFVLAGDGDVEQVRQIIRQRQLQEQVDVPGWVDADAVTGLLRDADIYVLPSYDEGLPMGVLEGMAAGLPVISTPVGGIPEAVIDGQNGFLVAPGDSATLAEKLLLLANNMELWRAASRASSLLAETEFSMHGVEQQLRDLYADLGVMV